MKVRFVVLALIVALVTSQACQVSPDQRGDCGFMGIDKTACEAKGCCWGPVRLLTQDKSGQQSNGVPWCFYPAGQSPCGNITFSGTSGPGFDQSFYDQMYALFDKNINIEGKGGIVAAPDHSTPGGSYYYHWMRDAGLTMRTYQEINNNDLSKFETKMKAYAGWVKKVQAETDPQGFDVRINPKFQLPDGQVYVGGWCRPQTDGPGLRSAALLGYAQALIDAGRQSEVNDLAPTIKNDLDWVLTNWQGDGCDLWEEVRSNDFFWGRAAFVYAFDLCEKVFNKIGDSSYASKCSSTKSSVQATLDAHWTGTYMKESTNREKDGSVVHAFSSFGAYPITDEKVAKTMKVLATTFCNEYAINQASVKAGTPGILIGRYPGDSYAGGNPWQLLTAVYAKTFYQGANALMEQNGFLKEQDKKAWFDLLKIPESASLKQQIQSAVQAGDSVMNLLYQAVKGDGGHIAQQIDRGSGKQKSANDLTWSFANILSAMKQGAKAANGLKNFVELKKE